MGSTSQYHAPIGPIIFDWYLVSGGIENSNEVITDPTLMFQASPPVGWTYYPVISGAAPGAPVCFEFLDIFQVERKLSAVLYPKSVVNIDVEWINTLLE